jgi:hypothetical protein
MKPSTIRAAGTWWKRLNRKPPGWDSPGRFWGRMAQAVFLGLVFWYIRSR